MIIKSKVNMNIGINGEIFTLTKGKDVNLELYDKFSDDSKKAYFEVQNDVSEKLSKETDKQVKKLNK